MQSGQEVSSNDCNTYDQSPCVSSVNTNPPSGKSGLLDARLTELTILFYLTGNQFLHIAPLTNLMKRDKKLVPLTSSFGSPKANYRSRIIALSDILLVMMVVLSPSTEALLLC